MAKVRRTPYAFFYLEDDYLLDVAALLRGDAPEPAPEARILALAVLTGERHQLSREELELLLTVPAEHWIDDDGLDLEVTRDLTQKGLLLSDAADGRLGVLRERDDALAANEWNLYAALYHYMTQWSGVDIRDDDEGDLELSIRSNAAAAGARRSTRAPSGRIRELSPDPGSAASRPRTRGLVVPDLDGSADDPIV